MAAPNPSSITFDLSGLGAQLATAIGGTMGSIKTVLEKLSEQLSTSHDKKAEELDIMGMREQILADVEVLFPILYNGTNGPSHLPSEPKFHLITRGSDLETYCCVLFSFPVKDGIRVEKGALIEGPGASNIAQALEGVHELTRKLLEAMGEKYEDDDGMIAIAHDDDSFYYMRD